MDRGLQLSQRVPGKCGQMTPLASMTTAILRHWGAILGVEEMGQATLWAAAQDYLESPADQIGSLAITLPPVMTWCLEKPGQSRQRK